MLTDLKPCPFCGGDPDFDHDDDGWNWIVCQRCGATTNASASLMDDCKPLLAERWNSRAIAAERDAMQAKVAEQSAEIARLKTVPMKYRRMAFNAQLQEENTRLSGELESLQIVSDRGFAVQKATIAQQAERIAELEKFQEDAFVAHPNLDLDIEALTQKGNQNVSN